MRNPPTSADPRLCSDDPSIVSVQIENGVAEVAVCVNTW